MSAQGIGPFIRNTRLSVCSFFDLELDYTVSPRNNYGLQ